MKFRQCEPNPVDLVLDCTPADTKLNARADEQGGGSTYFPVYANNDDLLQTDAGKGQFRQFSLRVRWDAQKQRDVMTPSQLNATLYDTLSITVSADRKEQIHFLGYDLLFPVEPGKKTDGCGSTAGACTKRVKADKTGSFDIEVIKESGEHVVVGNLKVVPPVHAFSLLIQGNSMTPSQLHATQGEELSIKVTADRKEELHILGYDQRFVLQPGQPLTQKFVTDKSGSFDIEVIKASGEHVVVGRLKIVPPGHKIQCDHEHECFIHATTSLNHTYMARISFAPSPDACLAETAKALQGTGSAAASRAMYRWIVATCLPPRSLPMGFATHNDSDAYKDFLSGLTDYGITSLVPPASHSGSDRTYKLAPVSASAVVLAYRAYDTRGNQITSLTLTPDIIARIYMDQTNNFSTEQSIKDLNPGINFPSRVQWVMRAEHNSETYIFTSWLSAVAPNTWKPPASPSADIAPPIGGELHRKTSEQAVAIDVVNPSTGFDPQVFRIGLMDSSTAAFYGLPTVKIAFPDGTSVAATPDTIREAIAQSQAAPDGTLIPRWSNSANPLGWYGLGKPAYPMPMVTYMIVPTNTIDPTKGDVLAKFLRYIVQDGQTLLTDDDGYARLPDALVKSSLAAADLIPVPAPTPAPSPPTAAETPPPLPTLPTPTESTTPAPARNASPARTSKASAARNSALAALTYSQGLELAAAVHDELGFFREEFALPALFTLMMLLIAGSLVLRLWARRTGRRQS